MHVLRAYILMFAASHCLMAVLGACPSPGRAGGLRNGNDIAIRFEVRGGVSEREQQLTGGPPVQL